MFHNSSRAGSPSASATHRPCRMVRLGSRTAWRRRPRSCATIGAVAATTPIENSSSTNMTLTPSTLAASASGPSQPIMTTSVVWIATWPTLVSTIGTASAVSARASRRHAPARGPLQVPSIVAMAPSYRETDPAGTRKGAGGRIFHPTDRGRAVLIARPCFRRTAAQRLDGFNCFSRARGAAAWRAGGT